MKWPLVLGLLAIFGCSKSGEFTSSDLDYINTSVDVIRTRTALPLGTDSIIMQHAVDSVLTRHHTTIADYKTSTRTLAEDAEHAQKIFEAVRDSLKRK